MRGDPWCDCLSAQFIIYMNESCWSRSESIAAGKTLMEAPLVGLQWSRLGFDQRTCGYLFLRIFFCQFVSSIFFVWVQSRNINIFWHSPWLIDRSNITDVLLHVLRRRINIPAPCRQDFFFWFIYFLGGTVGFVIHVSLISVVITVEERRNRPFCSAWSLPLTITLERP